MAEDPRAIGACGKEAVEHVHVVGCVHMKQELLADNGGGIGAPKGQVLEQWQHQRWTAGDEVVLFMGLPRGVVVVQSHMSWCG